MSGHFVIWNVTVNDIYTDIPQIFTGAKLSSTIAHLKKEPITKTGGISLLAPGWGRHSRGIIDEVMAKRSTEIKEGRHALPPHQYIDIPAFPNPSPTDVSNIRGMKIFDDLCRPGNMGLRDLCTLANTSWTQGDKPGALIDQLAQGAVHIEIYFIDRKEVGLGLKY